MELTKKEVPIEIEEKVLKFANEKIKFTIKEVFEKYSNNPEFLLRYAINNLRIDNKIFIHGNKRGAYYSINKNEESDNIENKHIEEEKNNSSLRERILKNAKEDWFTRPQLNIEDVSIPIVLKVINELVLEGKLDIRGSRRWTEYKLINIHSNQTSTTETEKNKTIKEEKSENIKNNILEYIKNNKVATIPMIIEEFELQRYVIVPILEELCKEEVIYHEGIKKSSKYIYHTVNSTEVEKIVHKLNEDRRLDQQIDALSEFLIYEETAAISIGLNADEKLEFKFIRNGNSTKKTFDNINDGFKYIKQLTDAR